MNPDVAMRLKIEDAGSTRTPTRGSSQSTRSSASLARGDARRNAYEVDVEILGPLQSLFRDRAVGLLVVHHSKKDAGDDFLAPWVSG